MKKTLLRVYDKLGVSNRVELVLYALAHREDYKSEVLPFAQGGAAKKTTDLTVKPDRIQTGSVAYRYGTN